MKWRDFLLVPKKHRRARSGARSEVGSLKVPSDVDLAAPRPTESTPDLRIGTPTLPMPGPLTPRDQEPNSTQTILSWMVYLTALFCATQTPTRCPIESYLFPEEIKVMVIAQNPWVILLTQGSHLRPNQVGVPPHMPQPS